MKRLRIKVWDLARKFGAYHDAVFDNSLFVERDSEDRGTHYHPNECRVCRVSIAQCICEEGPEVSDESA